MKIQTKLTLGLISSLLVASLASATDDTHKMSKNTSETHANCMEKMSGDMKKNPVATATKNLSELQAQLGLSQAQQPAWETFSKQVKEQAEKMATMQGEMKSGSESTPQAAPVHMAKMAEMIEGKAKSVAAISDALKVFYATLSPDQQKTFDKVHMSHMEQMKSPG